MTRVRTIFRNWNKTSYPSGFGRIWFVLLLALLFPAGCADQQETPLLDLDAPATPDEISAATQHDATRQAFLFGFDLRNGPKEDALQYLPLLRYLQQTTGHRFTLRFTEGAGHLLGELSSGHLQFAAIGAGSYLSARRNAPIVPLVHGVNAAGEAGYRALVVVAPDSPLQQLQSLRGRRLAFGGRTSTQGYWIPRIMLYRAGLTLDDLASYAFTGSHRACAEAVIAAKADACGLQDTLAQRLIETGQVRQLAASELYPSSGIFAHAGVPKAVREAVREALIAFDPNGRDRAGLYHWEDTEMAGGFVAASAGDYAPLRTWAARLGLLDAASAVEKP